MFVRTLNYRKARNCSGFTLIELLVVVAIIGLLVAIMIPSLNLAREAGNELVCKTQMDQIFKGSFMFVEDDLDNRIPHMGFRSYRWVAQIANTMGHLEPRIFRCPSDEQPQKFLNLERSGSGYYVKEDRPADKKDASVKFASLFVTYKGRCDTVDQDWLHLLGRRITDFTQPDQEIFLVEGTGYTDKLIGHCMRTSVLWDLATPEAQESFSGDLHTWDRHTGTTNLIFLDGHIDRVTSFQVGQIATGQQYGGVYRY